MNEQYIKDLYNYLDGDKNNWNYDSFKSDISSNSDYNKQIYDYLEGDKNGWSYDSFTLDTGLKKKEDTEISLLGFSPKQDLSSQGFTESKSELLSTNNLDYKEDALDVGINKKEGPVLGVDETYGDDSKILNSLERNNRRIQSITSNNPDDELNYREVLDMTVQDNFLSDKDKNYLDIIKIYNLAKNQAEFYPDDLKFQEDYKNISKELQDAEARKFSEYDDKIKFWQDYKDKNIKLGNITNVKGADEVLNNFMKLKEPFFNKIEQKSSEINSQAIKENKDPNILLQELIQGKMQELMDIENETENQYSGFSGYLNYVKDFWGIGENNKEYKKNQLKSELEELSSIAYLNKRPDIQKEDFVTQFSKELPGALGDVTDVFRTSEEKNRSLISALSESGTIGNVEKDLLGRIEYESRDKGLSDPEYWATQLANVVPIVGQTFIGAGVVSNVSKIPAIAKTISSTEKAIQLSKASKLYNAFKPGLRTGVEFYTAGKIFETNKDDLNFTSGFVGGIVGSRFEKSIGDFINKTNSPILKLLSGSTGEVVQEYGEEFGASLNKFIESDDYNKFITDLDDKFGTLNKNVKFIITAGIMGGAMKLGSIEGRKLANEINNKYNSLSEEEKVQVEDSFKKINKSINKQDIINLDEESAEDIKNDLNSLKESGKITEEEFLQKSQDLDNVVNANQGIPDVYNTDDKMSVVSLNLLRNEIENDRSSIPAQKERNARQLELIDKKLNDIDKNYFGLPIEDVINNIDDIISDLSNIEEEVDLDESKFYGIQKTLSDIGLDPNTIIPENSTKTAKDIINKLGEYKLKLNKNKEEFPVLQNESLNNESKVIDLNKDNIIIEKNKDKIKEWNNALLTGNKKESESSFFLEGIDNNDTDTIALMNVKKVSESILENESLDDINDLLQDDVNGLDKGIKNYIASSLASKSFEENDLEKATYYNNLALKSRSKSGQELRSISLTKEIPHYQVSEIILNNINEINAKKNEVLPSGKTIQEEVEEDSQSILNKIKEKLLGSENTKEYDDLISDIDKYIDKKIKNKLDLKERNEEDYKKIKNAKKKIDVIRQKLKQTKQTSSSFVGLSSEQIELLGDMAIAYSQIGVSSISIIIRNIKLAAKEDLNYDLTDDDLSKILRPFNTNVNIWQKEKDEAVKAISEKVLNIFEGDNIDSSRKKQNQDPELERFSKNLKKHILSNFKEENSTKEVREDLAIKDFLNNLEKYLEVIEQIRVETFGDKVMPLEIQDLLDMKFFNDDLKKRLSKFNLRELIRSHFSNLDVVSDNIFNVIKRDLSVSDKTAQFISDKINSFVKEQAYSLAQKEIDGIIKRKGKKVKQKTKHQRLLELFNLGAFNRNDFNGIFYEDYGISELSSNDINELRRLSKITEVTSGKLQKEYLNKFIEYINTIKDVNKENTFWKMIDDIFYRNILSGLTTQMTAIRGGFLASTSQIALRILQNPKASLMLLFNSKLLKSQQNILKTYQEIINKGTSISALQESSPKSSSKISKLTDAKLSDLVKDKRIISAIISALWAKPTAYFTRMLSAQDTVMGTRLKELEYYYQVYNSLSSKDLNMKDIYNKIQEGMKTTEDDLQKAENQYQQERINLLELGENINDRYKQARINDIIDSYRNQELLNQAIKTAQDVLLVGDVYGVLGRIHKKLQPGDDANALSTLTRIILYPFQRVPFNFFNAVINYSPLGFYNPDQTYSSLKGKKIDKTPQEKIDQYWKASLGTIVIGSLFSYLFEYDEEKGAWKVNDEASFGITGSGYGVGMDGFVKNQSIDPNYKDHSIYFYVDGKRVNLSYKDNPFGLSLTFLGEMMDEMTLRNYQRMNKNQQERYVSEVLGGAIMSTFWFSSSQSYTQGLKTIENVFGLIGASDPDKQAKKIAKDIFFKPVKNLIMPNLYRQIYDINKWAMGKNEKISDDVLDVIMKDNFLLDDYMRGVNYDHFGFPVKKTLNIPILPDLVQNELFENWNYRQNNKYWKLIYDHPGVTLGFMPRPEVLINGKKIELEDEQASGFYRIYGEELRKTVERKYNKLSKMNTFDLQASISEYKADAVSEAKEEIIKKYYPD